MIKRLVLVVLSFVLVMSCVLVLSKSVFACSTMHVKSADGRGKWVGKTYDWDLGHGSLYVNQKDRIKVNTHPYSPKKFSWTSAYGSLTFSQFGKEFPVSGINEKDLIVETLWLNSSAYPDLNEQGVALLNELQWVQYILDTSASVEEAISQAAQVDILPLQGQVHYFVCDQTQCAAFEYLNKKLVINKTGSGSKYSVLTNSEYQKSVLNLKNYTEFGGNRPIPSNYDSLARFARMAAQIQAKPQAADASEIIARLGSVRHTTQTQWTLVYDFEAKTVEFFTKESSSRKKIQLDKLNFDCKEETLVFDMNSKSEGSITNNLIKLTPEYDKAMIMKNTFLDLEMQTQLSEYPSKYTSCK